MSPYLLLTIGVDPGMSGAIAILDGYGRLVTVFDMPTGNGAVSAQQVAALADWANGCTYGTVVLEDVHSMPKQGVASSFGFGRSKGVIEGVFAMARRPIVYVAPSTWKRGLRLTKDKGASRQRAVELWPDRADWFRLAKHDGRAEAALIARWHIDKEGSPR